jgi:iron complex transport system ATP-binding protein
LLRAASVSFAYGSHRVLDEVDVAIAPGALVGILGPNGSGKTTLITVLGGIARPARGEVTLDGTTLSRLSRVEIARRMAIVPQDTHLTFDYSVLEVALMGRYPHLSSFELEGPRDIEIARHALAATGTSDLEQRSFLSLSGGERQRVVIASALAQLADAEVATPPPDGRGPSRVLLLDEPTASLDPAYQLEVADILRELSTRGHLTIAVCTHDLNFAAGLCRELVMLRDGRVIAAGPTDEVLTPETIRRLYGIDADVQRLAATGRLSVVPLRRVSAGPGA